MHSVRILLLIWHNGRIIQGEQRVSMHLLEVGCISGSHSGCTVLSVARNVGNDMRGRVSEVMFATCSVLRVGLPTFRTVQHPSCTNTQGFLLILYMENLCKARYLPTVFYVLDFRLLAQCSTLLAQIHRDFCSSCIWRTSVKQDMMT